MTNWNYQKIVGLDGITDSPFAVLRLPDQALVPSDPANTDYAAYLQWVEQGGTPEPAPEPVAPVELTPAEKLAASGLTVDELKSLLGLD
jgi:hypothetical protein